MTLQLNPDTTDDYESKSLAQMRQLVFDGLGFISPLTVQRQGFGARGSIQNFYTTLKDLRVGIINRLGLALALSSNTDTYTNIYNDVYAALGYAGMASAPPGVATLIGDWITQAQSTLLARIEFDWKSATRPTSFTSGSSVIDATPIRQLAIAYGKAHDGSPDAQAWGQQAERYLSDLTQRTPPNITGQINQELVEANQTILRRYELGNTGSVTSTFGSALQIAYDYTLTTSDNDATDVDPQAVQLLALANLKKKIGQADADKYYDQYEQYLADTMRRFPPNATSIVNNQLKMTQQTLYRKYEVFRMERWWTWTLVQGQRFYGLFSSDFESSVAPTDGLAVIGTAVTDHDLGSERYQPLHITLNNGKVLIFGGRSSNSGILVTAELYDPTTGIFTPTGNMIVARVQAAAVKLDNGNVFVCGGYNGNILAFCEIYDVASGTWALTTYLPSARTTHTATLLQDGRVLIAGGDGPSPTPAIFDPSDLSMTVTGVMVHGRVGATSTLLPNGTVLFTGTASATNTAEIYTPGTGGTGSFSATTGNMTTGRTGQTATMLPNGFVLIAGGSSTPFSAPTPLSSAELYNPNTGLFTATGSMANARYGHGAILTANELVLVAGDNAGGTTAEVYDEGTELWTTTGAMPVGVSWGSFDSLQDGRVLIAGGTTSTINPFVLLPPAVTAVKTAMLFDQDALTFSATGNLTHGTVYYQITAYTANGESLPGTEFFVAAVPNNTSVILTWTPTPDQPFVLGYKIYGRVSGGTKELIATVPDTVMTYTDEGTIPPNGALPTENNTAGPGNIDPRNVTWVGLSFNNNVWNPLIKGIPPMAFAQNINGVPTNYEIRQALEIWPAPTSTDWKVQIKGYFEPQVFVDDNDQTTIDWQAIYLQTLADVMPRFKAQRGQPWFNQLEIMDATRKSLEYIGRLVAGSHMTARYVPGAVLQRNAVRPVLVGPYIGYP